MYRSTVMVNKDEYIFRPWKSGRIHLAEGSNVVVLELPYSTEFVRESRKFASGVRKYGKFDDGR